MTEIWLVRHGETSANAAGVWQGQADVGLNDRGREQAGALGARLNATAFDLLMSSDLSRARDTAAGAGLAASADAAWREMDIGAWDGLTREEVMARHGDELLALVAGEDIPVGGGERWSGFRARVESALTALRQRLGPEERALVVTHGAVVHAILSGALGLRPRPPSLLEHPANTAVTVLATADGGWKVRTMNDASHLGRAPAPDGRTTVVGLARHGESEANTLGIWHGTTDGPLSGRGREQGGELAARYDAVDHLYSSHLQRARLTAAAFGRARGLEAAVHPGLQEMAYGRWEGLTAEQIQATFPEDWAENYVDGNDVPRGRTGETAAGAAGRMLQAVQELAAGHPGQRVLAFSHGGAIRACVGGILGLGVAARDLLESPGNVSVTHLRVGARGVAVSDYNTGAV
jgi:broad specificity phosphatase PhoE